MVDSEIPSRVATSPPHTNLVLWMPSYAARPPAALSSGFTEWELRIPLSEGKVLPIAAHHQRLVKGPMKGPAPQRRTALKGHPSAAPELPERSGFT